MRYEYRYTKITKENSYIAGLDEYSNTRKGRHHNLRLLLSPTKEDLRNNIKNTIEKAIKQAHDIGWTADNGDKIGISTIKEYGPLDVKYSKTVEYISRLFINGDFRRVVKRRIVKNPHYVVRCDKCWTITKKGNLCEQCRRLEQTTV